MTMRYKLFYGSDSDKAIGVFETDPLDGWNGEEKTLRIEDVRGKSHTLQIGPGIPVRSSSFSNSGAPRRLR